jgi:hypothetical protein
VQQYAAELCYGGQFPEGHVEKLKFVRSMDSDFVAILLMEFIRRWKGEYSLIINVLS